MKPVSIDHYVLAAEVFPNSEIPAEYVPVNDYSVIFAGALCGYSYLVPGCHKQIDDIWRVFSVISWNIWYYCSIYNGGNAFFAL